MVQKIGRLTKTFYFCENLYYMVFLNWLNRNDITTSNGFIVIVSLALRYSYNNIN